jgi:hypothetical protein
VDDFSLKRVLVGVWLGFPVVLFTAVVLGSSPFSKTPKPRPAMAEQQEHPEASAASLAAMP